MLHLPNVTLINVDCVEINRAIRSMEICTEHIHFNRAVLVTSIDKMIAHPVIEIKECRKIRDIKDYSKFLIEELHGYFNTSHCLLTQWHGFVMNPEAWINDYLQYDYIGARWWFHTDHKVGNGGFSLRSKKWCQTVSKQAWTWKQFHPEDDVCCRQRYEELTALGLKIAPEEIALQFSVENEPYNGQFGMHDIGKGQPELFHERFYKK